LPHAISKKVLETFLKLFHEGIHYPAEHFQYAIHHFLPITNEIHYLHENYNFWQKFACDYWTTVAQM
jgi:hypothetical protein